MNDIRQEIMKSSKIMVIITRILCISLALGLCIPAAFLIWRAISPQADLSARNGIRFYSSAGRLVTTASELTAEMSTIFVSGVLVFCVLFLACRLFQSIRADANPFSQDNAVRLKKIAIFLMVYAIAQPIARACFYGLFAPEITMYTSLNVVSIVLALVFFFISIVFTYGADLQKLSDETL